MTITKRVYQEAWYARWKSRVSKILRQLWRVCRDIWYWDRSNKWDDYLLQKEKWPEPKLRRLKRLRGNPKSTEAALEKKGDDYTPIRGLSVLIDFPRLGKLE